jgi:pyrroloquinoline quinone biosynthesis protein B
LTRIRILGAAAGGGLPQWNCACRNCRDARAGKIPQLTQSSVVISANAASRYLINASPDLPAQLENCPQLHPRSQRESRFAAVFLTNSDIDHSLGLLLLRQQEQPLVVYAPRAIRDDLRWVDRLLSRFCQIEWRDGPGRIERLEVQRIDLERSVAWFFRDQQTSKTVLLAPAVHAISRELQEAMQRSDAIFFDGTFWSDDELKRFRVNARTAGEMGHLPVEQSLAQLSDAPTQRKIYIHINNTNPILQPHSPERKQVEGAGISVGFDGMEFEL